MSKIVNWQIVNWQIYQLAKWSTYIIFNWQIVTWQSLPGKMITWQLFHMAKCQLAWQLCHLAKLLHVKNRLASLYMAILHCQIAAGKVNCKNQKIMNSAILMSPNRTKHCVYGYIYIYMSKEQRTTVSNLYVKCIHYELQVYIKYSIQYLIYLTPNIFLPTRKVKSEKHSWKNAFLQMC